jgi:protein phosphatase PTC7
MRRSVLQAKLARSILPYLPRSDIQSSQPCPPRAFSTTAIALTDDTHPAHSNTAPFRFETGLSLFAKRPPRPFPPPFLSPPSGSFSDPLSTHHRSRDRRTFVNGELIRGYTNGDDAVYVSDMFIGANDGVGAWSTRPGGHAGLALRLKFQTNAK